MKNMNISRYVSPMAFRSMFQGKRTLQQSKPLDVSTAILAGVGSTALIVFYYNIHYNICSTIEAERRPIQYSPNATSLLLQYMHLSRRSVTRCDVPSEDSESVIPQVATAVHYSEAYDPDLDLDSSGYTEEERFYQCVSYHRSLLHDYDRRWGQGKSYTFSDGAVQSLSSRKSSSKSVVHHHNDTKAGWPRNIPTADEVTGLECDLFYCQRSPEYQSNIGFCQSTKFRIASYYVSSQNNDKCSQREKGFRVIKELAEQGYPDAMCFYGILLNEGTIDGVEANPRQAVVWWRRCVDEHGHINSTYELANACYLGDGIVENAPMAVSLFRRAAHLGHAGAAYMLGECLLNGVGVERDRTDALEWLVTSAELGHRGAQDRVLLILNVDYGNYSAASDVAKQRQLEETIKWIDHDIDIASYDPKLEPLHKAVSIERRFTIGGGSRNPVIVARRKSIVAESRNES